MRGVLGLIGLLVTLVIVGFLARQQLQSVHAPLPVMPVPVATPSGSPVGTAIPNPAPLDLSQPSSQVQKQMKQALEGAMQARPMREEP
jgi:hypothetical protein